MSTISKNWSKVKTIFQNMFSKNAIKLQKEQATQSYTKHIDLPALEEDRKKVGLHLVNNRKATMGRINQRIPMFTDMFGRVHYKHIVHSW